MLLVEDDAAWIQAAGEYPHHPLVVLCEAVAALGYGLGLVLLALVHAQILRRARAGTAGRHPAARTCPVLARSTRLSSALITKAPR